MPKLIANEVLRYAGKELAAGDEFDASDTDAFVLRGVGKARDVVAAAALETKDESAELGRRGTSRAGRYSRADMRAKD